MADQETQNEPVEPCNHHQVVEGGSSIGITRKDKSRTEESQRKAISSSEETKKTQIGRLVLEEKERILSRRRVCLWAGRKKECKENFPLTYSLLYGIEEEGKPISCDLEAKSTDNGDRKKKGKDDEVSSSRIGGFQIDQAVGLHFDSVKMEGVSDEDVARFRIYKDPVKRGNLSEEELKECEEGAKMLEAVMKKWDGFGFWEGLAELGPDREEFDEVMREINKYYSEKSILVVSVEVVAQLESKLCWLKEENARLTSLWHRVYGEWCQGYDSELFLCAQNLYSLRLGQRKELERRAELLNTLMWKLDLYKETAAEDLVKSSFKTLLIAEDKWIKILDLERELAFRREGLARPEDQERNAEHELEYLRVQQAWSELESSCMELESDLSGLMESQEKMVEELGKRRMEVQQLENEMREKNKVVKQLKEEFLKRTRQRSERPNGK